MPEMDVARVRLMAPFVSFRYPHFLVGRQPSYDMPPPSTIYGHIASAAGELIPPRSLRFSYTFSFVAKGGDLEHQHVIGPYPPEKLARAESANFRAWRRTHGLSVGGSVQPTLREFLFGVELTLYLHPPALAKAFRAPVFPVVLGRSQDLATVVSVEELALEEAEGAYFDATLLPFSWRRRTRFGTTVVMPRFIGEPPEREPVFAQYIVLPRDQTVYGGTADVPADHPRRLLRYENGDDRWLVDPTSTVRHGVRRGVVWLTFLD
jgi:CRISPR-associated protein Cas5t